MRLRCWPKKGGVATAGPAAVPSDGTLSRLVTHRQFVKGVLALAGGAGLAGAAGVGRADFVPGNPTPDVVDRSLLVQGNLIVDGNADIDVASPLARLDVAGEIRVSGTEAIGSDAVAKQCYYASPAGTWTKAAGNTWGYYNPDWTWGELATQL